MKVIIIGAGVMGMMQARELAQQGCRVTLIDKGLCGAEASWAGGGIISPLYPWRYPAAVTALATWSQAYYPNLIQTLEAESDIDPELTRHGLLMLHVEDQDLALNWSESTKSWLDPIDKETLYNFEPNLRYGFQQALWMSQVSSVRNPRLLKALRKILEHHALVELKEESAVVDFIADGPRVAGVRTARGEDIYGDLIVLCSGAWSQLLAASQAISIQPVKGQMILFNAQPGIVNRIVLMDGKYLIPRRDGGIVVGSTMEYTEFDKSTTEQAKNELADLAIDLFPELASCPVSHHWAGLRPGSPAGIPYIGRLPEYDNVYINAGHFRNGLVLAPASVRLMTALLCQQPLPVDPEPYDPMRARCHP